MRASTTDGALGVLDRMTRILEAFDQEDSGLTISELATRAGLPKSTVSRLVSTLVRQRYLERDGRVIHLGLRLFELGQLAEQPRELRMAALPVMADLRNRTGENVHLAIRDGGEMVCIAVMRSPSAAAPVVRTGARLPVHATALGKAALAHAVPAELTSVLGAELEACTPQTIT
ncbi:MAG TPA: IclR family transcriptional regulator, partial [Microbacterium sp.]|nr:IclR family transcriptional regulator [Microbacterium sp.]